MVASCLANPPFKGTVDAESINDDLKAVTNTKKTEASIVPENVQERVLFECHVI